jgi:predicted transcriptional regulator
MMKTQAHRPTDAELEILRVLWDRGSSTVREVQENLDGRRPVGYTTVLKLMQIMTEKGLLERDERERAHRYVPKATREQTQQRLVSELLDRAFAGSASSLVMQALASRRADPEELAAIRRMLEEIQQEEGR